MDDPAGRPRLNADAPLGARLADALAGADGLDAAVAYVKRSGVAILEAAGLPDATRFVVGTGFGLTDPDAVEALDRLDALVRVVVGSDGLAASAFHPKLYLVRRRTLLTVFSGSANLTGGGLETNVEQYEELRMEATSPAGMAHARRFDALWSLGIPLADLRETSAWERYREWAARKRERARADEADDRAAAAEIRARVAPRRGRGLGGARGDPFALEGRLHELLGEATRVVPAARRDANVMLDGAIGTTTFQRAGLEVDGGELAVAVWPAELQGQAHALYGTERAPSLVRFVDGHGGWSGRPAPQLAFRFATVPQRIYLTSRLTLEDYVRQWVEDDLEHVHSYPRDELGRELMPWLIERGYASSCDAAELPRFEQSLGARSAHLRPGLALRCAWPLGEAEDLDRRGALAPAIRTALGALLEALDEPPLPA